MLFCSFYPCAKHSKLNVLCFVFGADAAQAITIALSVIVSKLFIACGNLLEYMFASLFGAVLQIVFDRFVTSFAALISSVNGYIFRAEYGAYLSSNFCLLKRLFSIYFRMICVSVAGIINAVFDGLTRHTVAPAVDAFTKEYNGPDRSVVATITTIVCGYFGGVLSFTATAATINIQNLLIQTEKNMQTIMKINYETFNILSLFEQLKQSLKKLTMDNNNYTNNQDEAKQMEKMEYHEYKPSTNNLNVNVIHGGINILGDDDNLTVVSGVTDITGITGFTSVSSMAAPLSMVDALIVVMGIGINNLESNIINTFLKYWKYKIFYNFNNNYAIKWNGDDIDQVIQDSRKYIVQNNHDGLMFFLSSHGDRDKVLYSTQASLFESYSEAQQGKQILDRILQVYYHPKMTFLLLIHQIQ